MLHALRGKARDITALLHCRDSTRMCYTTVKISLRPYQESCIQACLQSLQPGTDRATRVGVSLPTGSGKTTVFLSLLSRLPPRSVGPSSVASRTLIIVNSVELVHQTAAQARVLIPHLSVEIEQGARHKSSGLADV